MSILQDILAEKKREVAERKAQCSFVSLETKVAQTNQPRGFSEALRKKPGRAFIAEIKKASPSKGVLRGDLDPLSAAREYYLAGASCLSVLTDEKFFMGKLEYLSAIRREIPEIPLLRKDFVIDEYQVVEARVAGADAILLIVAALADDSLRSLAAKALSLDLDVLIEVHDEVEANRALAVVTDLLRESKNSSKASLLLGINNRNLHTFVTDLAVTEKILAHVPPRYRTAGNLLFVSESGIKTASDIGRLRLAGAQAFLVGESLIVSGSPGENLRKLISEVSEVDGS